ncbi:MAG: hypothetical protein U1E60_31440 [Reyranellaceae bacterium]
MVDACDRAGGRATLKQLGPFGKDGHMLAGADSGQPIWSPLLAEFLAELR